MHQELRVRMTITTVHNLFERVAQHFETLQQLPAVTTNISVTNTNIRISLPIFQKKHKFIMDMTKYLMEPERQKFYKNIENL